MHAIEPKTTYLKDYTPPAYLADELKLTFKIFEDHTSVHAKSTFHKNCSDSHSLILNGEHLKLISVKLDGEEIPYNLDSQFLTINDVPDTFTLEIETEIDPSNNTRLEGLYKSGGNWCTQCEAEGFRTITYFPDRPDVMTIFTVRVEADKTTCPVLLSNGNLIEEGELENNRHFTVWHDPFPKSCYLFALVAGNLVYIQDFFTTHSNHEVDLRIYVRAGDEDQCSWAMESLIKAMKWDEETYGREYQLDRFNIVAVSDFNMGAMENTSLNIFNTALVLAHPDTATDTDFERVEAVIAHEYFHNWSGNRVTCRDWFQLSLKEGLTVFRDQEFSADLNSRDVKRIDDIITLRRMQFAEDAGPLAHPVRPDNYIEINNFYTVTVYEKGAELIRMQRTLLGKETYRAATDLYFSRYEGMAVTCDDFLHCMEEASGRDLSHFKLWYSQAGTPEVLAVDSYNQKLNIYTLELSQKIPPTPGQPEKKPMHIPVLVGLIGPNGEDIEERLLELQEEKQIFTFENISSRPVPSILRGVSAPVKLQTNLSSEDLCFLMIHDKDSFNRWEAGQTLSLRMFSSMLSNNEKGKQEEVWLEFLSSFKDLLDQASIETSNKALLARSLNLPDLHIIAQECLLIDPAAIYKVRQSALQAINTNFGDTLRKIYQDNHDVIFSRDILAKSRRSLKNTILRILNDVTLAKAQYDTACCMTDHVSALSVLSNNEGREKEEAFTDFYNKFKKHMLVIDKWFSLQSTSTSEGTLKAVQTLKSHPDFTIKNPNRARALLGSFSMNNPTCFHSPDGSGYEFLANAVIELDKINPQIAARLLTPFKEWKRYVPSLQDLMKSSLEKIQSTEDLSPNVFEIVTKCLTF